MERMGKIQLDLQCDKIVTCWLCSYGLRNANKLSLLVRREFRERTKNESHFIEIRNVLNDYQTKRKGQK